MGKEIMRVRSKSFLNSSGFSFSELVVVIAIIAVLVAISFPIFSKWAPQYRLKQASRDLYSAIQSIRLTAIKTNREANIDFSVAPQHQYAYTLSGVSKIVRLSEYGSGIKFQDQTDTLTFTKPSFRFDGRGFGMDNFTGEVYLSNANNTDFYQVSLSPNGIISLKQWDGADYK